MSLFEPPILPAQTALRPATRNSLRNDGEGLPAPRMPPGPHDPTMLAAGAQDGADHAASAMAQEEGLPPSELADSAAMPQDGGLPCDILDDGRHHAYDNTPANTHRNSHGNSHENTSENIHDGAGFRPEQDLVAHRQRGAIADRSVTVVSRDSHGPIFHPSARMTEPRHPVGHDRRPGSSWSEQEQGGAATSAAGSMPTSLVGMAMPSPGAALNADTSRAPDADMVIPDGASGAGAPQGNYRNWRGHRKPIPANFAPGADDDTAPVAAVPVLDHTPPSSSTVGRRAPSRAELLASLEYPKTMTADGLARRQPRWFRNDPPDSGTQLESSEQAAGNLGAAFLPLEPSNPRNRGAAQPSGSGQKNAHGRSRQGFARSVAADPNESDNFFGRSSELKGCADRIHYLAMVAANSASPLRPAQPQASPLLPKIGPRTRLECERRCGSDGFCDPSSVLGCGGEYCGRPFFKL